MADGVFPTRPSRSRGALVSHEHARRRFERRPYIFTTSEPLAVGAVAEDLTAPSLGPSLPFARGDVAFGDPATSTRRNANAPWQDTKKPSRLYARHRARSHRRGKKNRQLPIGHRAVPSVPRATVWISLGRRASARSRREPVAEIDPDAGERLRGTVRGDNGRPSGHRFYERPSGAGIDLSAR